MGQRYPKTARLRLRREFAPLLLRGEAFPGAQALVRRLPNEGGGARLGVATPRTYGAAVARNRFRRLVREAFRRVRDRLGDHDYLVSPLRTLERPTLRGLERDLLRTAVATPRPARAPRERPRVRRRSP